MNPELRLEAAAALPSRSLNLSCFTLLIGHLSGDSPINHRVAAVDALTRAKLSLEQLATLAGTVAQVGPLELNRLLAIFESVSDASVGEKLIAGLQKSPVLTSLRVDALKQRIAKFPAPYSCRPRPFMRRSMSRPPSRRSGSMSWSRSWGRAMSAAGRWSSATRKRPAQPVTRWGTRAGNVGPDLSRIGKIRSERDLLESILFPSVSLVRSYEPILIVTHSARRTTD